jgi:type VI secretion system secreted protein VgrG
MSATASGKKTPNLIRVTGLPESGPALRVVGMTAAERVSTSFQISIELQPAKPAKFDFDAFTASMWGRKVSVSLRPSANATDSVRHFHGEVERLHLEDTAASRAMPLVVVELRPSLWRLSRSADTRLFTDKTTRDIVSHILDSHGLAGQYHWHTKPSAKPRTRPHCWQMREIDLDFVQRLLEEEGFIYWFTFTASGHELHIADGPQWLPNLGGNPLRLGVIGPDSDGKGHVAQWRRSVAAGPASYFVRGRSVDGESMLTGEATSAGPGRVGILHDTDGLAGTVSECKAEAELRLAALAADCRTAAGSSDVRALTAGMAVSLAGRGKYRLMAVWHDATQKSATYANRLEAIHHDSPLAMARSRAKPLVCSTLATVAEGPDADGKYRLRFDVDRLQGASAWVPLARDTDLIFLPRVGHRVEVSFAENDPDRPSIVRVVNTSKIMPFDAAENPHLGGVFTPAHEFMFNSDPTDPWIKLHATGDTEDATLGARAVVTEKDRSEIVGGDAGWLIRKDAIWSVLGSCVNQITKSFSVDAESVTLKGSQRIVLMVGSSYIVIDSSGITINGKPLLHLNPPSGSAPSAPSRLKERANRKTKQPKPRKAKR